MSDPFGLQSEPWTSPEDQSVGPVTPHGKHRLPEARPVLALGLASVVLTGVSLPWVVVRGLDGKSTALNLFDLPGGTAIVLSFILVALAGLATSAFRRLAGVATIAAAMSVFSWMGVMTALSMSFLGSIIPSVRLAGIDLARAQLSQGPGVAVCVVAGMMLSYTVAVRLPRVSTYSSAVSLPISMLVLLGGLLILVTNMPGEWARLGAEDADLQIPITGDSLFGSGFVMLLAWLALGLCIAGFVIQRSEVAVAASAIGAIAGMGALLYAVFIRLGGSVYIWLLPSSVEDFAGSSYAWRLYVTAVAAILLIASPVIAIALPAEKSRVDISRKSTLQSRRVPLADLIGIGLCAASIVVAVVRAVA